MQDLKQKYEQEFHDFQLKTMFPNDYLPETFDDWKKRALQFHTPTSLKMSVAEFEELYRGKAPYNIGDMGTIISILERCTMKVLDMIFEDYISYQLAIEKLANQWKEIVEPETIRLQRKYEAMSRLSQPGQKKKTIPLGQA